MGDTYHESSREIPVFDSVDVIVCGGGTSGIFAALAAARGGAETFLIEKEGFLGGTATSYLVNPLPEMMGKGGLIGEFMDRMAELGGYVKHDPADVVYDFSLANTYDVELFKDVALEMLNDAGVKILLHTMAVRSILEEGTIKGIIVENKSGRQAVMGKRAIDCTGDGDVSAFSGAPFEKGRKKDGLMPSVSLLFHLQNEGKLKDNPAIPVGGIFLLAPVLMGLAREKGIDYEIPYDASFLVPMPVSRGRLLVNLAHVKNVDGTKAEDLTRAHIALRKQIREAVDLLKNHPYFQDAYVATTATNIYVRETRRITGEYVITEEDALSGRSFEDAVASCRYMIDVHPIDDTEVGRYDNHPPFDIPYRSLVPLKVENLLMAGRCVSSDRVAQSALRISGTCMSTGEAAGTAAALSVVEGLSPRELDGKLVKTLLEKNGVNIRPDESRMPKKCMLD
ncbi:MAG: FAD-dependent oxidoreductase [Deltaproteobacteria bacterium]|uniref:FAD-dependent oxidoreductase n=1 Tax=Candidatus Zymogenus saltonus TaxID=2844893 RepID=A0A9D8PSG9_9DELT|nr:FAD-dependent oxidoreductase [Candidatus Zymogenus saltonus]